MKQLVSLVSMATFRLNVDADLFGHDVFAGIPSASRLHVMNA